VLFRSYVEEASIRQGVAELVSPRFERHLLGTTDSEAIFFVFLSRLARRFEDFHLPGLPFGAVAEELRGTVKDILAVCDTYGEQQTKLTIIVTNGSLMIGHRYRMPLHLSTYKTKCPESDTCAFYRPSMCEAPVHDGIVRHLVLSSEKPAENPNVWVEVADGETVGVDWGMHFQRVAPASTREIAPSA
jgi:glutamine amidotransferase